MIVQYLYLMILWFVECENWKKTVLLCFLTQTEKSSSYHFFTIWHFNNYNWHFYFIYWIELLNYCPRFSRVKDFTASCHMIYWPPGCSFPSYLSWRFLNAPSRLKTLGSIKSIHFQGLSFSSSESPDLQEVLCCSQVTSTSRWWVIPSRIQNLSLNPRDIHARK